MIFPDTTMLLKQREAIADLLLDEEFSVPGLTFKKSYADIMTREELWQWTQGPLRQFLVQNDGTAEAPDSRGHVLMHNKLVGSIQVRQHRVRAWDCTALTVGSSYNAPVKTSASYSSPAGNHTLRSFAPGSPSTLWSTAAGATTQPSSDSFEAEHTADLKCFPLYQKGSCCYDTPDEFADNFYESHGYAWDDDTRYRFGSRAEVPSATIDATFQTTYGIADVDISCGACDPSVPESCELGHGTCARNDEYAYGCGWESCVLADDAPPTACNNMSGATYKVFASALGDSPLLFDELFPESIIFPDMRYGYGGYALELPRDADCARSALRQLENDNFIDAATRSIAFSFNLYNRNADIYITLRITFAFDPTGHVEKYAYIDAIKLSRFFFFAGLWNKDAMINVSAFLSKHFIASFFISTWLIMTAWQISKEVSDFALDPFNYVKDPWNVYDLIYFTFAFLFFWSAWKFLLASDQFEHALGIVEQYSCSGEVDVIDGNDCPSTDLYSRADYRQYKPADINSSGYVDSWYLREAFVEMRKWMALATSFYIFRVFKFLRLSKKSSLVWRVMALSYVELKGFMLVLSLLVFSFALFGVTMFGSSSRGFHNLPSAFMTLLHFALGDFYSRVAYEEMSYASSTFAWLYFLVFIILVCFVALNMFIAIVMASYEEAMEEKRWWAEKKKAVLGHRSTNDVTASIGKLSHHLSHSEITQSASDTIFPTWHIRPFDGEMDENDVRTARNIISDAKAGAGVLVKERLQHKSAYLLSEQKRQGSIIRVHYARDFCTASGDKIVSELHTPELTHRDRIAHQIALIKIEEMKQVHGSDVILLRGLRRNNTLVSQNGPMHRHLVDHLRPGEECHLLDRMSVLGNFLTLRFVDHESVSTRVDIRAATAAHSHSDDEWSTFQVRDTFADFEVSEIVGNLENYRVDSALMANLPSGAAMDRQRSITANGWCQHLWKTCAKRCTERPATAAEAREADDDGSDHTPVKTTRILLLDPVTRCFVDELALPMELSLWLWLRMLCASVCCKKMKNTNRHLCHDCADLSSLYSAWAAIKVWCSHCFCYRCSSRIRQDKEEQNVGRAVEYFLRDQCHFIKQRVQNHHGPGPPRC
jgi:hypothetical protein